MHLTPAMPPCRASQVYLKTGCCKDMLPVLLHVAMFDTCVAIWNLYHVDI